MKHVIVGLIVLACVGTTLEAESERRSFVNGWNGQSVVLKRVLYSLIYNERGKLGTTRNGLREGVLVTTPSLGDYFQFDARQARGTVVAKNKERLVLSVYAEYEPNALDVRPYRRLEPLEVHRFGPGVELIVSAVRIEPDEVKLEFVEPTGRKDPVTSLRIKWPLPFSPEFSERLPLEEVLRRFVEIKYR
jgi:hypothetical protein